MSKYISILITAIILFQSSNIHVGDILKLVHVIEHLELHKKNYGDDFFVFMSKHYGELKNSHKKQHKEEEKNHQHQPIHHDCGSQLQTTFVINKISYTISIPQAEEQTSNFYYQDKFSTFEKQKIFQPPKFS